MFSKGRIACCGASTLLIFLSIAVIIVALLVTLKIVPDQIDKTIKKEKVLIKYPNGTYNDYTKDWVQPKYVERIQYWVFDYKNPISVMNRGQLPDVDEKGPYTYIEDTFINITWQNEDNTFLNYTETINYRFDPTQSCLGCDPFTDTVLIPDISYFLAIEQFSSWANLCATLGLGDMCNDTSIAALYNTDVVPLLGDAFNAYDANPFIRVTVNQIFTGYAPPFYNNFLQHLLDTIATILSLVIGSPIDFPKLPPYQNVSYAQTLFYTSPQYNVLTGKSDYNKVGFIQALSMVDPYFPNITLSTDGNILPEKLWYDCSGSKSSDSLYARTIRGNTGDFFPSFLDTNSIVPIYVDSICRSINLAYKEKITYEGISAYRFVLPQSEMDWSKDQNCGFCFPLDHDYFNKKKNSFGYPNGVMDISHCQGGYPIAISKPHFFQADDVVKNFIPRFVSSDDDDIVMEVEPRTGVILRAHKRIQINFMAFQLPEINSLKVVMPGAYPIFWFNESFYADQGTINDLKSDLVNKIKLVQILCYSAVGVAALILLLSIISLFGVAFIRRQKND